MSVTASLHGAATLHSVVVRGGVGAATDTLRARQRLERALADVDWSPPGLGPQALLFVRRLVADGRRGVRPASEGGAFGLGVSVALRECVRAARRPWLHADAAEAEAVCFADEAELVACLWRDWARGAVAQRWWWQDVLGRVDVTRWLRVHALTHGERLVPVLTLLAERGEAVDCVARLDEADAAQAWRAVLRAYGLSESAAIAEPMASASAGAEDAPAVLHTTAAPGQTAVAPVRALGQLLSVVPELKSPQLRAEQRRLLALALALVRAPGWARTPALAAALHASMVSAGTNAAAESRPVARTLVHLRGKVTPVPPALDRAVQAPGQVATPVQRQAPRQTSAEEAAETLPAAPALTAIASEASAVTHIGLTDTDAPPSPSSVPSPIQAEPSPPCAGHPSPSAPTRNAAESAPVVPAAAPTSLRTRYGGVFYLLNAALALRLYGDFTMPRAPGLALSPWDLLAWTGRAWFGDDFVRDPVWALLATLAGRKPATPPGLAFAAPARWVIEAAWLTPWGEVDRLQVQAGAHRLHIWHPQGFAVIDVPRDRQQRPLQQARALCEGRVLLGAAALVRARPAVARVPRSDAARWLNHWRAYLDARLRHTLGLDDAPALLCCHDALVELSLAAVDVHLTLASLPLPIRYAGLDRDPGWIPAAGRSLTFHFS